MAIKGNIYQKGVSSQSGSIRIVANSRKRLGYRIVQISGASLVTFGIIWLVFTFGPIFKEEVAYRVKATSIPGISFTEEFAQAQETSEIQKEAEAYGVNSHFSVVIPKISATSNIVPNVDTSDKEAYSNSLLSGVAHARGTYFPGQGKTIYLFAHSTDLPINIGRYNAVFYLLRKLEPGDQIITYFADRRYLYKVSEKLVVNTDNVEWLAPKNTEQLVLQTCDPPGTTLNRLLVIADPVQNENQQ